MGLGYQRLDRRAFDYELWFVEDGRLCLRGPRRSVPEAPFLACVGAAQTFGRFVARPYPAQLEALSRRPVLNLGLSGAGPESFLKRGTLQELMRKAEIVVLQIMSGRSVSAGVFRCRANAGVLEFVEGPRAGEVRVAKDAYAILKREYGANAFSEQVAAVREAWVDRYRRLLGEIERPTYLLWMSNRSPHAMVEDPDDLGTFPHLVTEGMVAALAQHCAGTIDATLDKPVLQPLYDKLSGELVEVFDKTSFPNWQDSIRAFNTYYPSQEHHDLAAGRILASLAADARLTPSTLMRPPGEDSAAAPGAAG
jgi:hypothetical protein